MSLLDDPDALRRLGATLLRGEGRNGEANDLRADDQRVRALACTILAAARTAVGAAEAAYRRERIPPPSRAAPFPSPDAIAGARRLEALHGAIGAAEGRIRHAPMPPGNRASSAHRDEAALLRVILDEDRLLVGQAEAVRTLTGGKSPDTLVADAAEIERGLAAIDATLARRGIATL